MYNPEAEHILNDSSFKRSRRGMPRFRYIGEKHLPTHRVVATQAIDYQQEKPFNTDAFKNHWIFIDMSSAQYNNIVAFKHGVHKTDIDQTSRIWILRSRGLDRRYDE